MVKLQLGEWLKSDDVTTDLKILFLSEGVWESGEFGEQFVIRVSFEDADGVPSERKWSPNMTSLKVISSHHGLETKDWVGKSVTLFSADQNVSGKMRKVIYVRE